MLITTVHSLRKFTFLARVIRMGFLLTTISLVILGVQTVFCSASSTTIRVDTNDYMIQKRIYNLTSGVHVSIRKLPPERSGHVVTKVSNYVQPRLDQILVDISGLNKIVHVKRESQSIIVECGCSMETLLDTSLANGLVPKVFPEFRDITVGGAIVGGGVESSSFKHGLFHESCRTVYILCGDGNIIRSNRGDEIYKDLYGSLPGSHGTLGTVLCAEVECMAAKPIVHVQIYPFQDETEAGLQMIQTLCANPNVDFVEALQYPSGLMAVMAASMVDGASDDSPIFHPDKQSEQWFYEYIESACQRKQRHVHISIKSYLFRYDRGAFWMARPLRFQFNPRFILRSLPLLPLFVITHNNFLCRFLFRKYFSSRFLFALLRKAHPAVVAQKMVLMDLFAPMNKTKELIDIIRRNITALSTPLWLCPVKRIHADISQPFSPIHPRINDILIDVGIYGRLDDRNAAIYSRQLDIWSLRNNARKMLYSQHSYSEDEFWASDASALATSSAYDRRLYSRLRDKYGALQGGLEDLYLKMVNPENRIFRLSWRNFGWKKIVDILAYIIAFLLL